MFFPTSVVLTWWSCCWWFLTMLASCGDVWRTIEYTVLRLQTTQVVLSKKSIVWHLDAWSGCALDYATKHLWIEFYHRPGTRQDSRNCFAFACWVSSVDRYKTRNAAPWHQLWGQVPVLCCALLLSEALLSLQVQGTPCKTAGGSRFSQRVTTCLKLQVSVLVLRWAH